ncbi:MAG: hypothetical protein IJW40_02760 [Clostridia bacterium]|nr:hypothetical protein [Clostridia bacterium]
MVLEPQNTTVAYRCPHCGGAVYSGVNMFMLTADMLKLKCTCGQSEMTLIQSRSDEQKVRLSIPCMFCPKPHQFTMSRTLLFDKELFSLQCPYSDITICCVGEDNHVRAEMARSELELLDLLEENGITDPSVLRGSEGDSIPENFPTDPQVRDIVMFVIGELDAEGKIRCHCKGSDTHTYDVSIEDDGIRVSCGGCGASRWIPTDSSLAAHAFLHTDALDLTVDTPEEGE